MKFALGRLQEQQMIPEVAPEMMRGGVARYNKGRQRVAKEA